MSSYPWDLEIKANVSIDADDVLDYVKNNKQWFLDHIGDYKNNEEIKGEVKDLGVFVDSIIDKYNNVRIFRDASDKNLDDLKVKMYNDLVGIRESIKDIES